MGTFSLLRIPFPLFNLLEKVLQASIVHIAGKEIQEEEVGGGKFAQIFDNFLLLIFLSAVPDPQLGYLHPDGEGQEVVPDVLIVAEEHDAKVEENNGRNQQEQKQPKPEEDEYLLCDDVGCKNAHVPNRIFTPCSSSGFPITKRHSRKDFFQQLITCPINRKHPSTAKIDKLSLDEVIEEPDVENHIGKI